MVLASEAGTCPSNYYSYESRTKMPNLETLSKIAEALQVHISVLFRDLEDTP
jgi:transcriptional regulator with XRE-family HTH domain